MTDRILEGQLAQPARNKGGRPKKVASPVKADEPTETGPKKVRVRKGAAGGGPLHIPQDIVDRLWANGVSLQWVADTIIGQPDIQGRQQFTINAWEPVLGHMFGKVFDGMFYPAGYTGEINVGGQVLMHRPRELTEEATKENEAAARGPIEITKRKMKRGIIDGVPEQAQINTPAAQAWREEGWRNTGTIPVPD